MLPSTQLHRPSIVSGFGVSLYTALTAGGIGSLLSYRELVSHLFLFPPCSLTHSHPVRPLGINNLLSRSAFGASSDYRTETDRWGHPYRAFELTSTLLALLGLEPIRSLGFFQLRRYYQVLDPRGIFLRSLYGLDRISRTYSYLNIRTGSEVVENLHSIANAKATRKASTRKEQRRQPKGKTRVDYLRTTEQCELPNYGKRAKIEPDTDNGLFFSQLGMDGLAFSGPIDEEFLSIRVPGAAE
ncbi:hypothetical protein STAS_15525 [Striga asiatica]|uniref:Uncharacterized protein n=1 Tax=Striga asiatica TaxID=4170 RepID=A0A5A7Q2E3_STRAF|nr:hypothetical protein STAS_15525 [Striga asiatica]